MLCMRSFSPERVFLNPVAQTGLGKTCGCAAQASLIFSSAQPPKPDSSCRSSNWNFEPFHAIMLPQQLVFIRFGRAEISLLDKRRDAITFAISSTALPRSDKFSSTEVQDVIMNRTAVTHIVH